MEVPTCSEGEFRCSYPRCVRIDFRCDGDDDCGDWSDEDGCETITEGTCARHQFRYSYIFISSCWANYNFLFIKVINEIKRLYIDTS